MIKRFRNLMTLTRQPLIGCAAYNGGAMVSRRFLIESGLVLLPSTVAVAANTVAGSVDVGRDTLKFSGTDLGFTYDGSKVSITAKSLVVDGLTIPKLTWSWVGLSIAEGVLTGLGTLVVSLIARAFQRDSSQQDMRTFLAAVVREFESFVVDQLRRQRLEDSSSDIQTAYQLFQDYQDSKDQETLFRVYESSLTPYNRLQPLGIYGYKAALTAAGLHVAATQTYCKQRKLSRTQRLSIIDRHLDNAEQLTQSVESEIVAATDAHDYVWRYPGTWNRMTGLLPPNTPIGIGLPDQPIAHDLNQEMLLTERLDGRVWVWENRVHQHDAVELTPGQVQYLDKHLPIYAAYLHLRPVINLTAEREKLLLEFVKPGRLMINQLRVAAHADRT